MVTAEGSGSSFSGLAVLVLADVVVADVVAALRGQQPEDETGEYPAEHHQPPLPPHPVKTPF